MGNTQSMPRPNLYITKVSNNDLPLCPFIHTVLSFNSQPPQTLDPQLLKKTLMENDVCLEIMDIRNNSRFKITLPRGLEILGITVVKLIKIPELLNIRVIAVKESSTVQLMADDQIVGIADYFCEDEDELIYALKTSSSSQVVVLRNEHAELIELQSGDLGCEIGIGMLFKPKNLDYKMKNYNGNIMREEEVKVQENVSIQDLKESSKENIGDILNVDAKESIGNGVNSQVEDFKNPPEQNKREIENNPANFNNLNGINDSNEAKDIFDKFNESCNVSTSLNQAKLDENKGDFPPVKINDQNTGEPEKFADHAIFAPPDKANDQNAGEPQKFADRAIFTPPSKINDPNTREPESHGRTASYVYKSPRNSNDTKTPSSQKISQAIFTEARVPPESQYLNGDGIPTPEKAILLDKNFATREDFIEKDGQMRLKDESFNERKEKHTGNIQELFNDDESKNAEDFEFKINENSHAI